MRLFTLALLLAASGASAQALCEADPAGHRAADRAPLLTEIASGDGDALDALHAYLCAYTLEALTTTADLIRTLTLRDTVVARLSPRMEAWFFAPEGERYDDAGALYAETQALALLPVQAEGMIFGLTQGQLMDGVMTTLAPPDLMHYIDFTTAEGEGAGGEYPYMGLGAETVMLASGEALRRDFPASPYVGATQEAFGRALLTLASLHPVAFEGMDEPQWMAGVATAEFYPWASDREPLAQFVATQTESRYHTPLAAILANPPEANSEGAMEVVVIGGAYSSREDAEARTLAFLDSGIDTVGPLMIEDGVWHVVYRYYPADDARVGEAFSRVEDAGLTPDIVAYTPEVY